jgi:hypothetical protein
MKKLLLALFVIIITCTLVHGQDTLPQFSVRNVGNNRIIIGWTNSFESIKQLSIQRSFDSLKNYKTLITVPDPSTKQNGYVDLKAINDSMFYRLYIMLDRGVFLFSDAKRPVVDTLRKTNYTNRTDRIGGVDSVSIPNFSVNNKAKPNVFTPSVHVYTHKDGYVRINLPDDEDKKYSIKFFEEDERFLFEIKDIKERTFKIDKTNFYHAGWFRFELYEGDILIEKHKFYLQKDF